MVWRGEVSRGSSKESNLSYLRIRQLHPLERKSFFPSFAGALNHARGRPCRFLGGGLRGKTGVAARDPNAPTELRFDNYKLLHTAGGACDSANTEKAPVAAEMFGPTNQNTLMMDMETMMEDESPAKLKMFFQDLVSKQRNATAKAMPTLLRVGKK